MKIIEKKNTVFEKFNSDSLFDILGVILSLLYFVIVLLLTLSIRKTGNYGVETDFFWLYVPHAKSFLEGKIIIDSFHGPIYPIFLGLFSIVFSDFFLSGIILSTFSACVVLYFSYRCIAIISNKKLAFLVAAFLAINPIFIQYSYTCGTDMFFNAIISMTVFYFLNNEKNTISKILFSGFLAGIAYLIRSNAVFLLIIGFLTFFNSGVIPIKKKIFLSLLFYTSFILTNLPWNLYCYFVRDTFFLNANYLNIAFEMYNHGTLNRENFWFGENNFQSFWDVITYNPIIFLKTYLTNIYENFIKDLENFLGWQLGVFFVVGLLLKLRTIISHKQFLYLFLNAAYFLVLAFIFYSERFSLFLIPFYLYFSLLVFMSEDLSLNRFWPKDLVHIFIGILFIWTIIGAVEYNRIMINFGPKNLSKVKAKFEQNFIGNTENLILAARKPYIAYHLGLKFQVIPMANSFEEFITQLRGKKVDFLYWGSDEINSRPQIIFPISSDSLNYFGLKRLFSIGNKSAFYRFYNDSTRQ